MRITKRTLGIISIHAPARGATFKYLKNSVIEVCISIHAPARGATQISVSLYIIYIHFNPRSREGSDSVSPIRRRATFDNFNPRSREGSDLPLLERIKAMKNISIHAPARGATDSPKLSDREYDISIHAPARGATLTNLFASFLAIYFNPRSREGSDLQCLHQNHLPFLFQSTLPRGERLVDSAVISPLG